ncbi:hypothetical protein QTP88_028162 [Uroleucon formosanum]
MSSSSKTNTAATKHINKPPISPLILVKTKIPQTSDKPQLDFSDSDDIWQKVDSNKRIRSPITKSPPNKKADSNIFITKNRYASISPTTEIEPMDSTNDQPTENTANASVISPTATPVVTATIPQDAFVVVPPTILLSVKNLEMIQPNAHSVEVLILLTTGVVSHTRISSNTENLFQILIQTSEPAILILTIHPLSIFLWNANGILNNINELQLTLTENKIDIAMISETHLTQKNFLNIQDYEALRADHPDGSAHGGTVLLVSRRIPHSPFPHHTSDKLQIIATSIVLNSIPISFASA